MTKTEYIEKTRNEFSEVYSDNFPVYVEDETETFIAMMIYRNGTRYLYIIDMTPPYRQINLESMSKDEAVVYCDAINTKVFNRPAPKLNDPRVETLEKFKSDYDAFCDRCEGEIKEYLSKFPEKSIALPGLKGSLYPIFSVCNRYCTIYEAMMKDSKLRIVVTPEDMGDTEKPRLIGFDDIKRNPKILYDFMLEFYRATE